jgi:hypothetical protein
MNEEVIKKWLYDNNFFPKISKFDIYNYLSKQTNNFTDKGKIEMLLNDMHNFYAQIIIDFFFNCIKKGELKKPKWYNYSLAEIESNYGNIPYYKLCEKYLFECKDENYYLLNPKFNKFGYAKEILEKELQKITVSQQANNGKTTSEFKLPSGLNTERARKYFAKAIEAQYITTTDNGLKWVFGDERGKVILGYFIQKVFCPNNTGTIPETAVNKLFGVTRIGSAITQIASAKKPQKWRTEIDKLFE